MTTQPTHAAPPPPPPPPQYSPDGQWWWDGSKWSAAVRPPQPPVTAPVVIAPVKAKSFRYQQTTSGSVLIAILVAAGLYWGFTQVKESNTDDRKLKCSNARAFDSFNVDPNEPANEDIAKYC